MKTALTRALSVKIVNAKETLERNFVVHVA